MACPCSWTGTECELVNNWATVTGTEVVRLRGKRKLTRTKFQALKKNIFVLLYHTRRCGARSRRHLVRPSKEIWAPSVWHCWNGDVPIFLWILKRFLDAVFKAVRCWTALHLCMVAHLIFDTHRICRNRRASSRKLDPGMYMGLDMSMSSYITLDIYRPHRLYRSGPLYNLHMACIVYISYWWSCWRSYFLVLIWPCDPRCLRHFMCRSTGRKSQDLPYSGRRLVGPRAPWHFFPSLAGCFKGVMAVFIDELLDSR